MNRKRRGKWYRIDNKFFVAEGKCRQQRSTLLHKIAKMKKEYQKIDFQKMT